MLVCLTFFCALYMALTVSVFLNLKIQTTFTFIILGNDSLPMIQHRIIYSFQSKISYVILYKEANHPSLKLIKYLYKMGRAKCNFCASYLSIVFTSCGNRMEHTLNTDFEIFQQIKYSFLHKVVDNFS